MATPCRSSIRPRRPSPIPAASSSSSRKARARSRPAAPRPGRPTTRRASRAHRAEIRAETDKLGWSFAIHRTDRPATELLLALHARMGAPPPGAAIERPRHRVRATREARMIAGLPLGFAQPLVLLGLLSLPVLWWLLRLIPPPPRRVDFPPDAAAVRHRAEGRNAGAHAVVADAAAADARGAADHRGRRARCGIRRSRPRRRRAPLALLIDDGWAAAAHLGRPRAHRRRPDRARRDRRPRRRDHAALGGRARHLARDAGAPRACGCASSSRSRIRSSAPTRCRRSRASSPRRPTSRCSGSPTASMSAAARSSSTELGQAAARQARSPWSKAASRPRMRWPPPTMRPARSP